jgi:hypothetical protein
MLASKYGRSEALALLLANGANVNAANQVIQNFNTMNSIDNLKLNQFVARNLHLKLGRLYPRYVRLTIRAH